MDPRLAAVRKRLDQVKRTVAVTGGKGGIGKTLISSTLALLLAEKGLRAGLLDLDLTGPSDHVVLGADRFTFTEEFGVEPPEIHGVAFMSVSCFAGADPAPLRGEDVTNALIEMLAITRWGDLDVLVIDMPPGLGDALLDAMRIMREAEYLAVATRSRVVLETVRKNLHLLVGQSARIAGVVENMSAGSSPRVRDLAGDLGLPYLGDLPFDPLVEDALGEPKRLSETAFAGALRRVRDTLVPGR